MRIPTVRLRHKRKNRIVTVNESDWAQDLGRFKYSEYERVGERHNDAAKPIDIPESKTRPELERTTPRVQTQPPRGRGRPRKPLTP